MNEICTQRCFPQGAQNKLFPTKLCTSGNETKFMRKIQKKTSKEEHFFLLKHDPSVGFQKNGNESFMHPIIIDNYQCGKFKR